VARKKDEIDPLFKIRAEINEENYTEIRKMGILPLKLLEGILQVQMLGQYLSIDVVVYSNTGSLFYKKWRDLWIEQVSLWCFTNHSKSTGHNFTIRERFFYKSIYEQERRVSDLLPVEPFFYRHYLPDNKPPHQEGICWYTASETTQEHIARFETAQKILRLLGDSDYLKLRQRHLEALEEYMDTYPYDSEIITTKFNEILYPKSSHSRIYYDYKNVPLLSDEIEREFHRRKLQ
jgi:hypothetical protein